jgi:hypothetical protein
MDALLALTAILMLFKGCFGETRQLALAPALVAALDASFAGVITFGATPVLSILLTLLQLTVLGGSVFVLYQDSVRARNKQERRRRRRDILRTQMAFERARECGDTKRGYACA